MQLRRRKSRKTQIIDLLTTYLKLEAVRKTAKGAGKAGRKAAKGTAAYTAAKKTPIVLTIPFVAGAGVAAALAAKKLRGGDDEGSPAAA
jgi:hypothetical protein